MEFTISTEVEQPFAETDKTFNKETLEKLNPKFPPYRITCFDGLELGHRVHVEFNFGLFKDKWEYEIAEKVVNDREWSFVDAGTKMPFFLEYWRHRYQLREKNGKTIVSDTVQFRSPFRVLDLLLYPWLYLHFRYRQPVYRTLFRRKP